MRIDPVNDSLDWCTEMSYAAFRPNRQAGNTKNLVGLSVQVMSAEVTTPAEKSESGKAEGIVRLAVSTGGPVSNHYIPAGTHAPVQVQASVSLSGGWVQITSFNAQWVFGDRSDPIPDAVAAQIRSNVVALATMVVTTDEGAARCREALDRQAAKERHLAEQAVRELSRTVDDAVDDAVARIEGAVPAGREFSAEVLRARITEAVRPLVLAGHTEPVEEDTCPTCGPTKTEPHPRRKGTWRCTNCKEGLRVS